jgi:hypothetical protein
MELKEIVVMLLFVVLLLSFITHFQTNEGSYYNQTNTTGIKVLFEGETMLYVFAGFLLVGILFMLFAFVVRRGG